MKRPDPFSPCIGPGGPPPGGPPQAVLPRLGRSCLRFFQGLELFPGGPAARLAALLALAAATHGAAGDRPNIVFILADDLGYGDVHALNPQRGKIATPNLDRLAAQGMTFTDAHGGSSVCTPTRYGLLTGRYAWRSRLQRGVLDNYVTPLIAADRLTTPALLKQQGYHTACIGKWHLGFTIEGADSTGGKKKKKAAGAGKLEGAPLGARTADGPTTRGFDFFYGFHHARMIKSLFENDRVTEIVEPVDMLPKLARRAAGYVAERAKSGQPFFLYLALNSPHTPIVPSQEWRGKSGLGEYGDYVMETDWAAGEVLAALERAGVASNTLVFFASDNGCSPAAGIGRLEQQGHYPSAQFRGYKADIWDGGHRIPFIARWPGTIAAGSTNGQLVCLRRSPRHKTAGHSRRGQRQHSAGAAGQGGTSAARSRRAPFHQRLLRDPAGAVETRTVRRLRRLVRAEAGQQAGAGPAPGPALRHGKGRRRTRQRVRVPPGNRRAADEPAGEVRGGGPQHPREAADERRRHQPLEEGRSGRRSIGMNAS